MPFCLFPRCPVKVRAGYCPEHGRQDTRPAAATRGYGKRWQAYRAAFLARPENRVCVCGCGGRADTVDHIKAVSGPGDPLFWDPANHQAMTGDCHRRKTNRYDGGYGNPKRPIEAVA